MGKAKIEAQYILFDDGKTYIQLDEQDAYSYHDADYYARIINIIEDKVEWNRIMSNLEDANYDEFIY